MGDESERQSSEPEAPETTSSPASDEGQLREEQIKNAVGFLSHPKVRGSSESSKRSFLQQKGLTTAEIVEAFRRVPEVVPTIPQAAPPLPLPSAALTTTAANMQPAAYVEPPYMQHNRVPEQLRWSQVVLGAGFCAAGAYAVKSLVWPFVHNKYSAWRRDSQGEAAASPSNATADVADAIRAQTAELASSIKAIKELVTKLDLERLPSHDDHLTAAELRQELRDFASTLNEIAAPGAHTTGGTNNASVELELAEIKAMLSDYLRTPRSGDGTPTGWRDSKKTTPGSYRSATEHGPTSATGSPQQLPRPTTAQVDLTTDAAEQEPPIGRHPKSYMEVLEMLERGETPPGIRNDINDKPPNLEQEPVPSKLPRPPKPWEAAAPPQPHATSRAISNWESGSGSSISLGAALGKSETTAISHSKRANSDDHASGSVTTLPAPVASPHKELSANGKRNTPVSIYEAATSPTHSSPSVIAAQLSPSTRQSNIKGRPMQGTALFGDVSGEQSSSGYGGEIAGGEGPGSVGSKVESDTQSSLGVPDGNGIGRPGSRGWRPPPMPMPTISNSGDTGGVNSGMTRGLGSTPQSVSVKSLGEDFNN